MADKAAIRVLMKRYGADLTTGKADADLDGFIADALLLVPTAKLGKRADQATARKALSLMLDAKNPSSDSGGAIRRKRDGDTEIEYATAAAGSDGITNIHELRYRELLAGIVRPSPFVLNGQ